MTGGGFGAFFDAYSVTALGKKENVLTVSSPLVKTIGTGLNQLSLDHAAAYTLGTLNVTGAAILHTSSFGDVAIVDSTGADILRITDDGFINISASSMKLSPTSAGGLILLSSKSGPSIWFRDNLDVSFFGSIMLCSFATLTAKKLISLNGLTATYGTNVLDVNAANTTVTGPLVVNGTLTETGITSLLNPYATITAVNSKANSLTIVSPLVKTVGTGVNQLSLDTTAAYTLGTLNVTGAAILHTSSSEMLRSSTRQERTS